MSDWNEQIIAEFRANEGRVGGPFEGAPMILIHHVGAKSGVTRVTPLVHFPEDGGRTLIVASNGGQATNPHWYHNVKATPQFTVEVGTDTYAVEAEEVGPDERPGLWERVVTEFPGFADYQKTTDRTIPLVRLTRAA